jgi:hypothetical protein
MYFHFAAILRLFAVIILQSYKLAANKQQITAKKVKINNYLVA